MELKLKRVVVELEKEKEKSVCLEEDIMKLGDEGGGDGISCQGLRGINDC